MKLLDLKKEYSPVINKLRNIIIQEKKQKKYLIYLYYFNNL